MAEDDSRSASFQDLPRRGILADLAAAKKGEGYKNSISVVTWLDAGDRGEAP
jgi:hypothetical protein